jgi:beta-1,4-N-acetylglucosaminyltransferase
MATICLASSCGGHFMELIQLLPAVEKYDFYIITEKNIASKSILNKYRHYCLIQQERKGFTFLFKFALNIIISFCIYLKERPDVIISTGAGASYPTCRIAKLFGKKIIYIESFAKINDKSKTGELVYRFADKFYVQWPEMLNIYPKAEYHGTVY